MELIRGKTFIKSYAQHPPEKIPTVMYKGKKNVELGKNFNDCDIRGKTFIKTYPKNPPEKIPTVTYKVIKNVQPDKLLSECNSKNNSAQTQRMSNDICTKETDNVRCLKFIRKSKTHDCVLRDDKLEKITSQKVQGRIPNSLSSPGLVEDPCGKRNDIDANKQSACKQNMIDYRNFVPQMPFVPSVAKSLPRKRISLTKSKKSLKNIFNLKKNKQQDVISEEESQPMVFRMKETKAGERQYQLSIGEMPSDEFLLHNCLDYDMYIDAVDSFKALCEDVASLKSFDSLTGCGEIFADESASFIDIENSRVTFISKPNSQAASFQGGVEKLASPAKSESIDFSRLRGHLKASAKSVCSNVIPETERLPVCHDINKVEINNNLSRDQMSNLSYNDLMSSNENIHDAESPMSTSDEGYYDSYSPAVEENNNEVVNVRPLPRDTYSGDALYELFSDSCEKKLWTVQDCVSAPEDNKDNPTSVYSFCVGSEENMASQPTVGLDEEDSQENTWKGRECLLKLCDTELSLTIGMVNWLKRTGRITENDLGDQNITCTLEKSADTMNEKAFNAEETTGDHQENTLSHWEYVKTEHTDPANSSKGNIETFAKIPKSTIVSDESKSENNSQIGTHLDLYDPSPKQNILNIIEYKEKLELSSPDANTLASVVSTPKPNITNVSSLINHLDSLHLLDFQYPTCSIHENNRWLADMLEKSTADVPPLHVLFGNEYVLYSMSKIMRPYEIAQNIKNSVEKLQTSTDSQVNKKNMITDSKEPNQANSLCMKGFDDDYIGNQQCISKTSRLFPKEDQSSKEVVKPGFLPLFKSTCSSVISRCSSVLYKLHNSEDAIIFFNTRNYNPSPNSEDLTQGPSASSVDYSKYPEDDFLSITSTTFTRENGLVITKNKKWQI
ncbi:APC membrane recruitment protein 3 [Anomaloglossus baeobatrachus]|uniref:APC membrane recruitment protein 3 n=1 Tax=Anomaloglossus baeobatrachus TaxID=238106 RepID=UPI003F5032A3